jgi:hypothetical protein
MGSIDMSRRTVLIAPMLLGAIAVSGKAYAAPPTLNRPSSCPMAISRLSRGAATCRPVAAKWPRCTAI